MRIHNLFQFARESLTQIETSVQTKSTVCCALTYLGSAGLNVTQLVGWLVRWPPLPLFSSSNFNSSFFSVRSLNDSIVQSILFNDVITVTCLPFTSATVVWFHQDK